MKDVGNKENKALWCVKNEKKEFRGAMKEKKEIKMERREWDFEGKETN